MVPEKTPGRLIIVLLLSVLDTKLQATRFEARQLNYNLLLQLSSRKRISTFLIKFLSKASLSRNPLSQLLYDQYQSV